MSKKYLILFLILTFSYYNLFSESSETLMIEANKLYSKGKYDEALDNYNQILHKGYASLELYYNLGNTYFKLNKIPDAILFYERAKRISPDDEDLNFNLRVANLKIVDKINSVPKLFFIEWYDSISALHSSNGWSYMIIVFSWLTFILLSGYFLIWNIAIRKISFFSAIASFLITLMCIVFAFEQYHKENTRDEAIIFAPSVYIKSSPDKESTDLFILHEGTKIKILDEVGNWKKIKIADGNIGWLPDKTIEII